MNVSQNQPHSNFRQPLRVASLDLAFPARGAELIPAVNDIPLEFRSQSNVFYKMADELVNTGAITTSFPYRTKKSIDVDMLRQHLSVVMGCLTISHEHKEAGVAFLLAQWFEEIK